MNTQKKMIKSSFLSKKRQQRPHRFQLRHHSVIVFHLFSLWAVVEMLICLIVLLCHQNEYAENFLNGLCTKSDCGQFITKALFSRLVIAIFAFLGNVTVSVPMNLFILNIDWLAYVTHLLFIDYFFSNFFFNEFQFFFFWIRVSIFWCCHGSYAMLLEYFRCFQSQCHRFMSVSSRSKFYF